MIIEIRIAASKGNHQFNYLARVFLSEAGQDTCGCRPISLRCRITPTSTRPYMFPSICRDLVFKSMTRQGLIGFIFAQNPRVLTLLVGAEWIQPMVVEGNLVRSPSIISALLSYSPIGLYISLLKNLSEVLCIGTGERHVHQVLRGILISRA